MLTLTTRAALRRAIRDPALDPHLRAVLRLRHDQTGGAGADFHVAQPGDAPTDAEAAVGWPMLIDGSPQWEWAERHPGGWAEVVFVLSDDGPAQVLLAHETSPIAAALSEYADG